MNDSPHRPPVTVSKVLLSTMILTQSLGQWQDMQADWDLGVGATGSLNQPDEIRGTAIS